MPCLQLLNFMKFLIRSLPSTTYIPMQTSQIHFGFAIYRMGVVTSTWRYRLKNERSDWSVKSDITINCLCKQETCKIHFVIFDALLFENSSMHQWLWHGCTESLYPSSRIYFLKGSVNAPHNNFWVRRLLLLIS